MFRSFSLRTALVSFLASILVLCATLATILFLSPKNVKNRLAKFLTHNPSSTPKSPEKNLSTTPNPDETTTNQKLAALRTELEQRLSNTQAELQTTQNQAKKLASQLAAKNEKDDLQDNHVSDVRQLRNDIPFQTSIDFSNSPDIASRTRISPSSYTASYSLTLQIPKPATTLSQLETSNPHLSKALPGLAKCLESAKISPWFEKLYQEKISRLRRNATDLEELLTKHNLFDCETILELSAPNGQKICYIQADMDVVADGSDGDRLPTMPDSITNSAHYQPFTSYRWPKTSTTPNPLIPNWQRRINTAETETQKSSTTASRKKSLRERTAYLRRGINDMKSNSFLIAEYDPFIVIPVNLLTANNSPFTPKVGDYAIVIHQNRLLPAIVGDGGPNFKVGEASLRIAKELNPRSSPYSRPISDLTVAYLIFPNSADSPRTPPNYSHWHQRCLTLLNTIGGIAPGYELFTWQDTIPKPIPPTPPTPPSTQTDQSTNPAKSNPSPSPATTPPTPSPNLINSLNPNQ